jgi:RecB family exonuclease
MRLALSKLRSEEDPRNSIELTLGILDGEVSPLDDELIIPLKRISQLIKEGRKAKRAGGNISDIFWALWSNAKNYGGESLQKVWRESALRGGARGGLADRDLDAVIQLFEVARRFTDRLPDSKPELFIDQITNESILSDAITAKGIRDEVVSILTVHSAKGKEWEMVALSGLQEGVWPNLKQRGSLLGSERLVEHLRTGLKARDAIESSSRSALIEDERRLLHVAVSRAKSKLIVVAHNEEDSESSNYFDEMYEFVHGENSFDAPALSAPRAITQQAVVAELRDLVEGGDETAAKALNLLAKSGVTSANPDNWIGSKVISSEERAVSLDAEVSVSPSNLQVFSECGLKWFIERSGGKDGDSTAQLVGNAIHGIAQKFKETPDIKLPEIQELLSSNWKLIDQNKGWIKEYELAEALEKVEKLFYWQADASQLRKLVAVEAKFGTRIEKIYFNGSADRVEIDQDGKYFIVDLKSGSGSDVTYGAAKENKQLAAYQLAFLEGAFEDENLRGDVSGSSLVFLGNDAKKAAEKPQERIDQELIKADLISSAKSMTANEFVATQNKRCRTCAIKKICPIQPNGRTVLDGN